MVKSFFLKPEQEYIRKKERQGETQKTSKLMVLWVVSPSLSFFLERLDYCHIYFHCSHLLYNYMIIHWLFWKDMMTRICCEVSKFAYSWHLFCQRKWFPKIATKLCSKCCSLWTKDIKFHQLLCKRTSSPLSDFALLHAIHNLHLRKRGLGVL
jgi:hypothetical protein